MALTDLINYLEMIVNMNMKYLILVYIYDFSISFDMIIFHNN